MAAGRLSTQAAAQEAAVHGETDKSVLGYLGAPQPWFESFQNCESEFLSTAAVVVFSIVLRQGFIGIQTRRLAPQRTGT